ncbi:hypothetical protein chiPu_0000246 [Chiloscyllium punctatum]|uniref:Uncharacterized protein n=1 Tax=Chiloscyllium punctatum TaxID=137246 RepID=A0A401RUN9_CHIPU|nr:hypothetical protein [Chiloscyllium punctatum]
MQLTRAGKAAVCQGLDSGVSPVTEPQLQREAARPGDTVNGNMSGRSTATATGKSGSGRLPNWGSSSAYPLWESSLQTLSTCVSRENRR